MKLIMKRNLIQYFVIALLIAPTACSDYLDVNTDPNNPTEVTPNLILPVAQNFTASYMHGDRRLNHLGNMLMYNWSETQGFSWYDDEFGYTVTTTFYAPLFDVAYSNALKQYQVLSQLDSKYNNYVAIGNIMKVYHFQLLVDLYGDVPYFEALGRKLNPTPKYDPASTIYGDLLVKLDNAITLIKSSQEDSNMISPGNDDAMFGGDMIRWIRFANTLKVRILNRAKNVFGNAVVQSELTKIGNEGSGFITEDVVVNPGYLDEEDKQNPFWASFGKGPDGSETLNNRATCATQYILDYLTNTNDPRIDMLYEHPGTGHLGVDQGLEPGPEYSFQFVSNIGPGISVSATQGSIIFTLAESYFNLAEIELVNGGDPELLYYFGIASSFSTLGLTNSDFSAYVDQDITNVNYASSVDKLEAIITQKWLAVNGTTAEQSWFDYNRTGFPANLPVSNQASTTDRPVRLFYPASELSSNGGNVPPQPNAFTSKIFWAN
jgi:Starch-binding associating with outer membrane